MLAFIWTRVSVHLVKAAVGNFGLNINFFCVLYGKNVIGLILTDSY